MSSPRLFSSFSEASPRFPVKFHMTFSWGRILPDHQFLISVECLLKSALRRDPGRTQQVFITYSENLPSPLPGHSLPGASPSHLQGKSESFAHAQSLQRPSLRSVQFLTRAKMALYYSIFLFVKRCNYNFKCVVSRVICFLGTSS